VGLFYTAPEPTRGPTNGTGPTHTSALGAYRLLPHLNPDWFYLSGTGLPRLSWKTGRSTGVVVWYGMVNVDLYSAIITEVSNALNTLVSGEKPGFQVLSKGLIVMLCADVVRQGVPDHGAVHCKCSASNSG